jgi:uncharacterized protein YodC (DUF2158 family)
MADFKKGDTVELKSGGPIMTVTQIENNRIFCVWFEGSKKHQDIFDESTLEEASKSIAVFSV